MPEPFEDGAVEGDEPLEAQGKRALRADPMGRSGPSAAAGIL